MLCSMTVPSRMLRAANSVVVAVTFVVMRHGTGAARLHRQPWLSAIERLDLALFVGLENDGSRRGGGRASRPTMSLSFSANSGSFDSLNIPDVMRGELVSLKDALYATPSSRLPPLPAVGQSNGLLLPGGGDSAKSTTRCTVTTASGGLPGLRASYLAR